MPRFLLVDEQWSVLGEHEAPRTDWSVGEEFATADGRRFAIVGIVPSVEGALETWTVEPA